MELSKIKNQKLKLKVKVSQLMIKCALTGNEIENGYKILDQLCSIFGSENQKIDFFYSYLSDLEDILDNTQDEIYKLKDELTEQEFNSSCLIAESEVKRLNLTFKYYSERY